MSVDDAVFGYSDVVTMQGSETARRGCGKKVRGGKEPKIAAAPSLFPPVDA